MTERDEQVAVVRWLRLHGTLFCAVPNGGHRHRAVAARMKAEGVTPGAPDLLIFDPPPVEPDRCGTALEMKRSKGGRASPEQRTWLAELDRRGWVSLICHGANEAIRSLQRLGYGQKRGSA